MFEETDDLCGDLVNPRDYGVDFLDKEVGNDWKSAEKVVELLEKLGEENIALEEQVLTVSISGPPKVSAALSAADEARCSLQELLQREQLISGMLHQHLQGAELWMEDLGQTCSQVDSVERHMKYLQCLHHIEELSAEVQQCLMISSVWDAIRAVDSMAALDSGLNQSGCSHLQDFLRETLCFWHNIIKDRLSSDFEKILTQLHWPIISPSSQPLTPAAASQDVDSQLEVAVTQLLALQTSDDLLSQRTSASSQSPPSHQSVSSSSSSSLCLPIQIMMLPLSRRFRFHFHGNRQTNSLNKPEWYLTQVLIWMGSNSTFMDEKIQPALEAAGSTISARVELCRGLVALVQEKVANDAVRLLYDDVLFCHLVEEVLQFEKELRSNHSYPPALPSLLHIMVEDAVLEKWLAVEKKRTNS